VAAVAVVVGDAVEAEAGAVVEAGVAVPTLRRRCAAAVAIIAAAGAE